MLQIGTWNMHYAVFGCFSHSPARREDFTEVTRSSIFQILFTLLGQVDKRELEIFPQMVAYVKAAKAKIKEPRNKAYENVEHMFVAKLDFFKGDSTF